MPKSDVVTALVILTPTSPACAGSRGDRTKRDAKTIVTTDLVAVVAVDDLLGEIDWSGDEWDGDDIDDWHSSLSFEISQSPSLLERNVHDLVIIG
jgi:hypothetical protein